MDRIMNHPILGETPERRKVTFTYNGKTLEGYETIAIVCFDCLIADDITKRLSKYDNICIGNAKDSGLSKGVMVLTVQETKGLEFDCVILWKPDLKGFRGNPKLAKQLYVAATRALHELFVMQ